MGKWGGEYSMLNTQCSIFNGEMGRRGNGEENIQCSILNVQYSTEKWGDGEDEGFLVL
jgi:hypothetical protein